MEPRWSRRTPRGLTILVFLVDKTPLYASVTPVGDGAGLLPRRASLRLCLPRLPRLVMERIFGFFRAVYLTWEGEAVAFLYYAPARRAFRIGVPPQVVVRRAVRGGWRTEGRVLYGYHPRADGFLKVGDVHSHAGMPAFHSATDDHDDAETGLHLTLGRLDRQRPEVSASFVAHGARFLLRPEDVVEDFAVPLQPPRKWLERVTCREDGARRSADARRWPG